MKIDFTKASEGEILSKLDVILDSGTREIVLQASKTIEKHNTNAMEMLYAYDTTLGGIGIFSMKEKKGFGVYRSLFYVKMILSSPNVKSSTRQIVYMSCVYLEELLKKVVRSWPWENLSPDGLPLGTLVNRFSKHLTLPIAENLSWLSKNVYNVAKHHYNFEDEVEEPENFFTIEEAIAVYFICRKLGMELERLIGKDQEVLEWE